MSLLSFNILNLPYRQASLTGNRVKSEALQLDLYLEDPLFSDHNNHIANDNEGFKRVEAIDSALSTSSDFGLCYFSSHYPELLSKDINDTGRGLHEPRSNGLRNANIELMQPDTADIVECGMKSEHFSQVAKVQTSESPIQLDTHQICTPVSPLLESSYPLQASALSMHENLDGIETYICGTCCWTHPRVFSQITNISGDSSATPDVQNISRRKGVHRASYGPNLSSDEFFTELFKRFDDFEKANDAIEIRPSMEACITYITKNDLINEDFCEFTSSARPQSGGMSNQIKACKSFSELQSCLQNDPDLADSDGDLMIQILNCNSTSHTDKRKRSHQMIYSEECQITHSDQDSPSGLEKEPKLSAEGQRCTIFEESRNPSTNWRERKIHEVGNLADHKKSAKQIVKLILDNCVNNDMMHLHVSDSTSVVTAESKQPQQSQGFEANEIGGKTISICGVPDFETLQGLQMDRPPFLKRSSRKVRNLFKLMGSLVRSKISMVKKIL